MISDSVKSFIIVAWNPKVLLIYGVYEWLWLFEIANISEFLYADLKIYTKELSHKCVCEEISIIAVHLCTCCLPLNAYFFYAWNDVLFSTLHCKKFYCRVHPPFTHSCSFSPCLYHNVNVFEAAIIVYSA